MPEQNGSVASRDRYSRTFEVLELLVGRSDGMTVTEISKGLGLPISSSHNLLQRMVAAEVVNVTEDLRYSLGPRAVRLGIRISDGLEVRAIARRHLQDLARSTGEDIYLAVRLGHRVTYLDRVPGSRPVTVDIRLGQSLSLHATSVGKLFAAEQEPLRRRLLDAPRPALTEHTLTEVPDLERELDRIREQGFAISREEAIIGVVGLAVPVRDAYGSVVAALHISALRAQITEDSQRRLIEAASATAAAMERELGRHQDQPPGVAAAGS
ncbi:IclR family transcriptional regulator [Pseudonocardia sp. KRD291]|uniref:IclR family transcriptional regulator n=1 Tax=Pseudonocardia sp. KRD291 TaxID=2792007 RepID=UPI001C4A1A6C|nr:IclR family transcriptional regulator [Pseudonocardia sp. KRD291]MBW0104798.1 IclR family transcriptional regulator [Pseudonocardia sp. KRD291]